MTANKIPFDFDVVNYLEVEADAKKLASESPINKIPVLTTGEQKIFDSRVIANHLISQHKLRKLTLDEENYVSSVYSLLDVSVNLFMLKHAGFDIAPSNWYVDRQRERIPANLDFLKSWVKTLDPKNSSDWHFPAMSLYSYLYWANARGMLELSAYPEFENFVSRFAAAAGVHETDYLKIN